MERVTRHFQDELETLQQRLLAMGGLAEERVREAVRSLTSRDSSLVEHILIGDGAINDLHIEVDDRCFKLLALHQPMAADLRAIVAAVKINTDLERVGDLAVNIAEASNDICSTRQSSRSSTSRGWPISLKPCCAMHWTRSSVEMWRWRRRSLAKTIRSMA